MEAKSVQIQLTKNQVEEIKQAAKLCPFNATDGFEHLQLTISSTSITMLGGSSDKLFEKTIPFNAPYIAPMKFSIMADFLYSSLETYINSNIGPKRQENLGITLLVRDNQATEISFELGFTGSIRKRSLSPSLTCHENAANDTFARSHQTTINSAHLYKDLQMLTKHAEGNMKAIYLKSSKDHITALLNDGHEITEYRWPNENSSQYELLMDDETFITVKKALAYNQDKVKLSQFNHELHLDTGNQKLFFKQSRDLPQLKGKKPDIIIEDIQFEIYKRLFKDEISSYIKIREIKARNEAYVYFSNKNIMLFYRSDSTKTCRLLKVRHISSPYEGVFQFNPRSINTSRIKRTPEVFIGAINHSHKNNYTLTLRNSSEKGAPAIITLDCIKRDDLKTRAKEMLIEANKDKANSKIPEEPGDVQQDFFSCL